MFLLCMGFSSEAKGDDAYFIEPLSVLSVLGGWNIFGSLLDTMEIMDILLHYSIKRQLASEILSVRMNLKNGNLTSSHTDTTIVVMKRCRLFIGLQL
jgi:hypothetical protein